METDVKPSASAELIRWSVNRKKKVVLHMMRGEPIDALSWARERGLPPGGSHGAFLRWTPGTLIFTLPRLFRRFAGRIDEGLPAGTIFAGLLPVNSHKKIQRQSLSLCPLPKLLCDCYRKTICRVMNHPLCFFLFRRKVYFHQNISQLCIWADFRGLPW